MGANIVTVIEDTDNKQGWSTITLTHDPMGALLSSVMALDSGAVHTRLYTDGVLRSHSVTDTDANSANWSLRTTEWDATGAKVSRTTIKDNGIRLVEAYDPASGRRVERSEYDDANNNTWQSKSTFYDANTGAKTGTRKEMNNGFVFEEQFDIATGMRMSKTDIDAGDKRNWDSIELNFDLMTGEIVTRTWTYDTGITHHFIYEDEKRVSDIKTDVLNVEAWLTRELIYDDGGRVATREIINDDGSQSLETRVDNVRTELRLIDGDGAASAHDWKIRTETYHDSGPIAATVEVMDDSDIVETTYREDKSVSTRTTTDLSGNEAWHVEQLTYDEHGNLTGSAYFDEFGDAFIF